MRHQPSACAMLRRSAACVRPSRRGERDANAEEATGEKQLLRLERPLCKALYVGPTYNALSKARPSMTNQENEEVMRFRLCYTPLTGGSPTPLRSSTCPCSSRCSFSLYRCTPIWAMRGGSGCAASAWGAPPYGDHGCVAWVCVAKSRNLGLPDPLSRSLVLVCALRLGVCVLTSPFTSK